MSAFHPPLDITNPLFKSCLYNYLIYIIFLNRDSIRPFLGTMLVLDLCKNKTRVTMGESRVPVRLRWYSAGSLQYRPAGGNGWLQGSSGSFRSGSIGTRHLVPMETTATCPCG
ncbi:hypothetical protein TRIP_B40002 [uncultured Desulfatiglans sp.]|nr:hypothetical protein TRIP_B40002 [uncultured Desulfatiglans sp.]